MTSLFLFYILNPLLLIPLPYPNYQDSESTCYFMNPASFVLSCSHFCLCFAFLFLFFCIFTKFLYILLSIKVDVLAYDSSFHTHFFPLRHCDRLRVTVLLYLSLNYHCLSQEEGNNHLRLGRALTKY